MVTKTTESLDGVATVQPAAAAQQLPKPKSFWSGITAGINAGITDIFKDKKVEQLATNPLTAPKPAQAVEAPKVEAPKVEPKKAFDLATPMFIQKLLKDTSRSTFDKLKSLLPIPESLAPVVNMFLGKGTNAGVKVGLENGELNLTADVKMPGQGIKGTAILSLPMTAQPENDAVTELHPVLIDTLGKALNPLLSEKEQVKEVIKLLSTLPSEVLKFTWSNGSADIIITLPNGASLKLILEIPTSEESAKTPEKPDFLRELLKSILKENFAGIETFLSQDMIFNWDGSTSRFELRFPQQLALHIEKISSIDISNPILRKIIEALANNSTIIIPPNIRGTVNFKNPSIQFDKGTTFIVKNAPIPDITIDRISYDPTAEKIFLTLKTSWRFFPDAVLEDIKIDMKASPKKAPKEDTVEKPNIVKYAFVPVATKDVARPDAQHLLAPKEKISVFESLKQMVKIPKALEPLLGIFFANQTKLDITVGMEDNLTVSVNNLHISKLGVTGKASLKIPTQPTQEKQPVTLPREIEEIVEQIIKKTGGENLQPEQAALFSNLLDLALTLPNQNIRVQWEGNKSKATLFITLPGRMELTLELDVKNISAEHDTLPLRAKLLEVLDKLVIPEKESEQYYRYDKLLEVLNTVGANDPRRAQFLEVLQTNTDKDTIRAEFVKMPGTDILRMKLAEVLGEQFAQIEPFLSQTMSFKWDGENNAVLELPNMGVTGKASILFPKKLAAVSDKKAIDPKLREALTKLLSQDSKSSSPELINLIMTMSNQNLHIDWKGETKQAHLAVTLPGGMTLKLELDMQDIEGNKDILRTKLTEFLGDQFAADIEPLLGQTFTFNWDGENKEFNIKFHNEQKLRFKAFKYKKADGFFENIKRKIITWFLKHSVITLPKLLHGKVDLANGKITFYKGSSIFIRTLGITKQAGLRLISFARENWIDIGIAAFTLFGGLNIDIDRRTSDVEKAQIAIRDKTQEARKAKIAAHVPRAPDLD